jgi:hypothetical protein
VPTVSDALMQRFAEFQGDPLQQFRVRLRRHRAGEMRDMLADPAAITLEWFNQNVWRLESQTLVDGTPIKTGEVFNLAGMSDERLRELDGALAAGTLEFHGNAIWGSGTRIYGAQLQLTADQALSHVRRAAGVLTELGLDPMEKARALLELPGFGPNTATGLVMVFHPDRFALWNQVSRRVVASLDGETNDLTAFERDVGAIREALGGEDFLELDWFFYLLNERIADDGDTPSPPSQSAWWVNQGASYQRARSGAYLWAPLRDKAGNRPAHWENMKKLTPGDTVFHYADGKLRAVSRVITSAEAASRPDARDRQWEPDGDLVRVRCIDLNPIDLNALPYELRTGEGAGGPFTRAGAVNQGYLYPVSARFVEGIQRDFPNLASALDAARRTPRVWMVRGGAQGETEQRALSTGMALIGWPEIGDLSDVRSVDQLRDRLAEIYDPPQRGTYLGMLESFQRRIAVGDWVVMPRKERPRRVAVGRVTGGYQYLGGPGSPNVVSHGRPVEWVRRSLAYARFPDEMRRAFAARSAVQEVAVPKAADYIEAALAYESPSSGTDAIHLVLKWSDAYGATTMADHRAVAERQGAVWWGRLGSEGSTGLASKWVDKIRNQLDDEIRTNVFLYSAKSTWHAVLHGIETDEAAVDPALVPDYYDPSAHHTLWVKLSDFAEVDPDEIMTSYVLASSGNAVTEGGLGNQTPLIIRAVDEDDGQGGPIPIRPGAFDMDAVKDAAEACGLRLPVDIYAHVVAALESGKHVILTGPPGTAKTSLAEIVASVAHNAGRCRGHVLTTATADWTTYETIGGLRPDDTGKLTFEQGHFLDAIDHDEWLVIDELNRSNFDRAFGQLFTVLSGQAVELPYRREGKLGRLVLAPPYAPIPRGADVVAVPPAWRVIATMNVFDKSLLFEMSFALMRRFAFIEVPSPDHAVFEELILREAGGDSAAAALTAKFLELRRFKDVGPAVFMDIARFVHQRRKIGGEDEQLAFEAFYSYLLPQFEGIDQVEGENLYKAIKKLVGKARHERLRRTLNGVLGLDIRDASGRSAAELADEFGIDLDSEFDEDAGESDVGLG